jgi:hypothetical protein
MLDRLLLKCDYRQEDSCQPEPDRLNVGLGEALRHAVLDSDVLICRRMQQQKSSIADLTAKYFVSCHRWLPILDITSVERHLVDLDKTGSNTLALLLSMCVLASPMAVAEDALYPAIRSLYLSLQGKQSICMDLIQAGILIAAYEYGQSWPQRAYLTITASKSMAILLGFYPSSLQGPMTIEESRVCWGIAILERQVQHIPVRASLLNVIQGDKSQIRLSNPNSR